MTLLFIKIYNCFALLTYFVCDLLLFQKMIVSNKLQLFQLITWDWYYFRQRRMRGKSIAGTERPWDWDEKNILFLLYRKIESERSQSREWWYFRDQTWNISKFKYWYKDFNYFLVSFVSPIPIPIRNTLVQCFELQGNSFGPG